MYVYHYFAYFIVVTFALHSVSEKVYNCQIDGIAGIISALMGAASCTEDPVYTGCSLNIVIFSTNLESLPHLPRQHKAAIGC